MEAAQEIRVGRDGAVVVLTLDRPHKKNALTAPMYAALADALTAAEKDAEVRCVLLRGEGDSFCAGNDLAELAAAGAREDLAWEGNPLLTALARATVPVVAAVQGRAVGIGLTMLLHCDAVVLADDARLSAPFADLGLVPEAASSLLLPARVGHVRAFAVLALGEVLDAGTALAWGLAGAVVPAGELDRRAREVAGAVAARAPGAVRATKALMRDAAALEERIAAEGEAFVRRLRSPEAAEATARFFGRG